MLTEYDEENIDSPALIDKKKVSERNSENSSDNLVNTKRKDVGTILADNFTDMQIIHEFV